MISPSGGLKTMKIENEIMNKAFSFAAAKEKENVYFIGIGGIGMSALAKFFKERGYAVSGYDKVRTPLTEAMEQSGIAIHYEEDIAAIPANPALVVYTPAIPSDHKELVYLLQKAARVVKRSEVLEMITAGSFNICVSGTHGKTTITTMIAHILRDSGFGCNAFLGGMSVNYDSNYWSSNRNVCVVEADEYDRSFLKLTPQVAIITAMDADHLDIYGTAQQMENAFIEFSNRVSDDGLLVTHFGLKREKELNGKLEHLSYSINNDAADVFGEDIRMEEGSYEYTVDIEGTKLEGFRLNMGGMHNVENSIAAIAVANALDIEKEKIRAAIASFRGVKRRFEYIVRNQRIVFVDDYAHHPEELRALINGAKSLFRGRTCTVIFQPHLYSRTRDLADGFASALDLADNVVLLPIYPARELPIENINSSLIASKMETARVALVEKDGLLAWLEQYYSKQLNEDGELLITAGAGDIDTMVESVKKLVQNL
jgi:UDP-N-acetylmuramate--alanine ligase